MVVGPTSSGKTMLIKDILLQRDLMFKHPPRKVVFVYTAHQPFMSEDKYAFIDFTPTLPDIDAFDPNEHSILILDDILQSLGDKRTASVLSKLFLVDSHHKNITSGKSDDFKKIHYVEALRKFLQENRKIDDDTSDIRLDIEDKYQTTNDPHYIALKNKITGNTLKRGQTLYKLLLASPNISWDSSGLVTLNGSLITGSNITDLIAGALDQNYSDQHLFSP
ncbi:unnamed protein product, partial [Rotaria socialis]